MGTDAADRPPKHNPDAGNLRSLLKKPPGRRDAKRRQRRVVFNETKNEFFDADYIILIREECDPDGDDDDDDDDDDGVCTCHQHEVVRISCCECDDDGCDGGQQSPRFAPPVEFVDAATLSPPEGYKDLEGVDQEMAAFGQMTGGMREEREEAAEAMGEGAAVCRECSANQEFEADEGDNSQPTSDINKPKIDLGQKQEDDEDGEKETIDQSQQTTPTSPNSSDGQNYLLDSPALESNAPEENPPLPSHGSPVAGILKGGKLWRQQSLENNALRANEPVTKADSVSDDESSTTRTVRFTEEEKKDSCKSSPEGERQIDGKESPADETAPKPTPDPSAEMTLTFKLGNHVLISNNSLKPNSAVRQLFPCTKQQQPGGEGDHHHQQQQYLVTAESLRAFEEAKRSRLPQVVQSDSIKRVIERNTLRRSLLRYEPKSKRNAQRTDNSLVERIKQLTCDLDEAGVEAEELSARVSPTGEEGGNVEGAPERSQDTNKAKERNFSPSSSSTASSNSSSMSSTYKKITDLFGKREIPPDTTAETVTYEPKGVQTLPDIGGPYTEAQDKLPPKPTPIAESRKQFLSTLAPLTACVGHAANRDDHHYHLSNNHPQGLGGGEYTLEDIDEALADDEAIKKITPDVLAGTPASESGDELLVFVQQDANRIERIKKKYESDPKKDLDDDEHDDYGFNRRPSVRGIKPRFGSTSEILQQIQNQIHQPAPNAHHAAWPYYSETGLGREEDSNKVNARQNVPYQGVSEEGKARGYVPQTQHNYGQDNQYQSCGNQTYYQEVYKTHSAVIGVEIDCQTLAKGRNGRPLSPPPQELSRNYHQTMVYIPYNHIEGYQPVITTNAYQNNDYYRYSHNQVNKKYIEPVYQQKLPPEDPYCNSNVTAHKMMGKSPYSNNYQPLLVPSSRSESPLMGNYAMARGTQTGCISSCNYYQNQPSLTVRYRESLMRPQYKQVDYGNKVNRHSFPSVRPRYYSPDSSEHLLYPEDHNPQHNGHMMNGYYNYYAAKESPGSSPTKTRYIERGVPEGAASVSPQDSMNTASTNTSPTLSQSTNKPMFYAMNV